MGILTCRNSTLLRLPAHFETFSAALALTFPAAVGQFSRTAPTQVSAHATTGNDGPLVGDAIMTVPLASTVRTRHRVGLQAVEIFSSAQSHAIVSSLEGRD